MRTRPASRLIVLSPENHVLLFRFCHKDDALEGKTYWATPGGDLSIRSLLSRRRYVNYLKKRA